MDGETACTQLVSVTLASALGIALWIYAVPRREGGHRVVGTDDEGSSFTPPLARSDEPLTLGELQAVLDDTRGDGAAPGGIGHAWRAFSDHARVRATSHPPAPLDFETGIQRAADWVRAHGTWDPVEFAGRIEIDRELPPSWTRRPERG